jgi:hypothetical protein
MEGAICLANQDDERGSCTNTPPAPKGSTPAASSMSYQAQFARTRSNLDISFWVISLGILSSMCITCVFQSLRCDPHSCGSECSVSTAAAPRTNICYSLSPCANMLARLRWSTKLPALHWQQFSWQHGLPSLLAFYFIGLCTLAAMYRHTQWYHESGRTRLLAAARLVPRALAVVEVLLLLLLPPALVAQGGAPGSYRASKGGLSLLVFAIALPVSPPCTTATQSTPSDVQLRLHVQHPVDQNPCTMQRHPGAARIRWPSHGCTVLASPPTHQNRCAPTSASPPAHRERETHGASRQNRCPPGPLAPCSPELMCFRHCHQMPSSM